MEEGSTVLLVVDDGTGDGGALASFDVRPCMAVRARYRRLPRLINQVRAGGPPGSRHHQCCCGRRCLPPH